MAIGLVVVIVIDAANVMVFVFIFGVGVSNIIFTITSAYNDNNDRDSDKDKLKGCVCINGRNSAKSKQRPKIQFLVVDGEGADARLDVHAWNHPLRTKSTTIRLYSIYRIQVKEENVF